MTERFTPLYEWLSSFSDISQNEALVISRVKMWGQQGCFESYGRMAKFLKLDRSTVIRTVKKCLAKEYFFVTRPSNTKRILHFNHNKFTPAIMRGSGRLPPVEAVDGGSVPPVGGGREPPDGGSVPPVVVADCHPTIYSQDSKRQTKQLFENFAEIMTTQQDISKTTQKAQRLELIRTQAEQMKKEDAKT